MWKWIAEAPAFRHSTTAVAISLGLIGIEGCSSLVRPPLIAALISIVSNRSTNVAFISFASKSSHSHRASAPVLDDRHQQKTVSTVFPVFAMGNRLNGFSTM